MKTAYSYLRFSSPKQEWGDSERRQEQGARDYCLKQGLTLSEKSFADRGVSGWKGANRRGALGDLLKILKPGNYLLIEDNDRLSREDPLTALNLLHSIVFKGVIIVTIRDGSIITKDNFFALSTFIPNIIKGALAHEENQKKSMRLKEAWIGRRKKMAEGSFAGGMLPFWITKRSDGTLALIAERAKVVRLIFDLSYKGMGARSVVYKLNAEKVPTFRASKLWSNYGILYLLQNPAVYGAMQPRVRESGKRRPVGEEIPDYYPAVITKERFLAVRNKIQQRVIYGGGNLGNGKVSNLFAKVIKCSKCGKSVVLTGRGRRNGQYLVCSSHLYLKECTKAIISYPLLERSVLAYIKADKAAIQYFSADNQTAILQKELDEKQGQLLSIQKKLTILSEKALSEGLPTVLNNKMKELEQQQAALEAQCDSIRGKQFEAGHTMSFEEITAYIDAQLKQGRKATFNINREGEYEYVSRLPEDRYLVREALRNYVAAMVLDMETKQLSIQWKSGARTEIEMKSKRIVTKKAEYFYRSKTNGGKMGEWQALGHIPNLLKKSEQNVAQGEANSAR